MNPFNWIYSSTTQLCWYQIHHRQQSGVNSSHTVPEKWQYDIFSYLQTI